MERDLKCMYCAEKGITNPDVFIEIVDVELGAGWICKECFIESEKEKDEHLRELEQQLQAKEQECERLEEELNDLTWDIKTHLKVEKIKLDQLKAENDNIKETFDGLFKVQYKLADNNKKLRQCLTEIKVLSENVYCLTNALNRDMALFAKEILQKISEVENDE